MEREPIEEDEALSPASSSRKRSAVEPSTELELELNLNSPLLVALYEDRERNGDLILKTKTKSYKVHSFIACINSEKLKREFGEWSATNVNNNAGKWELKCPKEPDTTLENFVVALYGAELKEISKDVWETYLAVCLFAHKLEANLVSGYFCGILKKVCDRDLLTAIELAYRLEKRGITMQELVDVPLQSIANNFKTITQKHARNWMDLRQGTIIKLLERDDIDIDNEFELYQHVKKYAIYWKPFLKKKLKVQPTESRFNIQGADFGHMRELIKNFRFTNMTAEQFASVIRDNILNNDEIAWVVKYNSGLEDAIENPMFKVAPRVFIMDEKAEQPE